MNTRRAACSCGQLQVTIEGDPSRIALCHCLACQSRTGAVISNQARFRRDQVTISGKSTEWMRTAESGNAMTYHFCPTCGSTVYWENEGFPGQVHVAIGNFADPISPRQRSQYGSSHVTPGFPCRPTRRLSVPRSRDSSRGLRDHPSGLPHSGGTSPCESVATAPVQLHSPQALLSAQP